MLVQGAGPRRRKKIAESAGISNKLILKWVNRADLARVDGIGEEYADLLEYSGVDTVIELATRNPENLYLKMNAVNQARKLVRRMPGQKQVAAWIAQAKQLPRMIRY